MTVLALSRFIREGVIPLLVAYGLFLAILVRAARWGIIRERPGSCHGLRPQWWVLVGWLVRTAVGGYAVFVAIVAVFYVGLGQRTGRFLAQAAREGLFLTFLVVVPGLLAVTWIHGRVMRTVRRLKPPPL